MEATQPTCCLTRVINTGAEAYLAAVETIPVSLLGSPDELDRGRKLEGSPETLARDLAKDPLLGFLALFADYLIFKAEQGKRQAAQVLIMCLAESLAPAGFLGVLLMETLALLEGRCLSSLYLSPPSANQ